jgi:hypothetical protein
MLTARVAIITPKVSSVTSGAAVAAKCFRAERPISNTARNMNTKIPAAASVSNLR